MNLNQIQDAALIETTESMVRQERELLTSILRYLREIERRRLFSALGYKSLFDFAVRRLGYSEDQAYRRIAAMRLLTELPEIETQIQSGEISLTHIGLAHSLFRQEKKTQQEMPRHQKLMVIQKMANQPTREAERIACSFSSSSQTFRPDRVHSVSDKNVELKFTATAEIMKKIDQLKGLLAHQHPHLSLGELFEKLCDLGLQEWNPVKTAAPRKRCVTKPVSQAQVRRDIFARAKNQCECCGSYYALEIDHVIPQAKGGSSAPENLRLLCRSCNQRAAIQEFGQLQMDSYIN